MSENLNRFRDMLSQIFEMDKADLDFGIYRIINQKRNEINSFLDKDLIPLVKSELQKYENKDQKKIQDELDKAVKQAEEIGADPDSSKKVLELKLKLKKQVDVSSLESEVFSHLTIFFRRYYDKGDFISKRRYKEGVYAIPYEGEEVKLYWANHDQYYIKTSENFKNYIFTLESGKKVHFKIVEAETEKDNNKAQGNKARRFFLCEDTPFEITDDELVINFNYTAADKKKQEALNREAAVKILSFKDVTNWSKELSSLLPTEKNKDRTLLEKHLNDYTAKNSFDYFIHKDLGGFLRRELDFFIKNEVMHIDDLDTEHELDVKLYLSKVKVIKRIGYKIIELLEQIENFQKKLWLKKKFVVQSDYCITLDRIPEELYPEILKNRDQIEEWKRLFAIHEMTGETPSPTAGEGRGEGEEAEDDEDSEETLFDEEEYKAAVDDVIEENETFVPYSEPLTIDFLKVNRYLVLDTKFFDSSFKDKVISSMDDVDEKCDGLLINSENFQALNFIHVRYYEQIKSVYIDPPYNTGNDDFIYKDGYLSSSWCSFLYDRIRIAKEIIKKDGAHFASIDSNEVSSLSTILNICFPNKINKDYFIWKRKAGGGSDSKFIAIDHEYVLFGLRENADFFEMDYSEDGAARFNDKDEKGSFYLKTLERPIRLGPRPNLQYSIKAPDGRDIEYRHDGIKYTWVVSKTTFEKMHGEGEIIFKKNQKGSWSVYRKVYMSKTVPRSLWADIALNRDATQEAKDLWNNTELFSNPKPTKLLKHILSFSLDKNSTILDYFAGSGTTGHAVINLNREDGGTRKYILVEMGEYFDTVTKPRIQKVIYSKDWKNGRPVSRKGSSHIFKYMRLESYEDTLNNLELSAKDIQHTLDKLPDSAKEEYILRYMLDMETRKSNSLLNINRLKDPFNYTLKITRQNAMNEEKIDLVETFNYLLGLKVKRISPSVDVEHAFEKNSDGKLVIADKKGKKESFTFKTVHGENREGESVLVIWRVMGDDIEKDNTALSKFFDDNFKKSKFDKVYVNGDCNIPGTLLTEEHFKRLMFDVADV